MPDDDHSSDCCRTTRKKPPAEGHGQSLARILVCEDEARLRRIYAKHLTAAGYEVIESCDGEEALAAMAEHEVQLVLTDLMMPRMDGLELCRRVRACPQWQDVPFIMLTARDSVESQVEGLERGADDYIIKPVQPAILMARVRRALQRQRAIIAHAGLESGFGGLRIEEPIGSGSFGEVFLALDEKLGREVAVKIIRREYATDPAARARFLREGKAMCAVRHPGVVAVHAVGEYEGRPYIVMEHLTGGDLYERLLVERRLPWGEVISIGRQVAAALSALHQAWIIHRDIKPENILFDTEGRAVLVDFGIALIADSSRLTTDGTIMGTLFYMAPEQFNDEPADSRTDIYALGVVMYEALAGDVPIRALTPQGMLARIFTAAPKPLAELGVEVDQRLEELVQAMLAKNPDNRPQRASEVVAALDALIPR